MEFRFDIRPIFASPITRVTSSMLPQNFRGDRKSALDCAQKVSEIINTVGEHSAKAQGLTKAVTTAQKLRQSDHKIYLLADADDGKNGSVIGMLKVGKKSLYVFDETGNTKMIETPCVLDFYIHETRQRAGLGKDLFETMLETENWQPIKLAIDRPSDKLKGFLRKHYELERTIPQMNNFVIYKGFFDQHKNGVNNGNGVNNNNNNDDFKNVHLTSSPNTNLFGPIRTSSEETFRSIRAEQTASLYPNKIHNAPIGRYAAARPVGSMSEFRSVIRGGTLHRLGVQRRSGLQMDDIDNMPKFDVPPPSNNPRRAQHNQIIGNVNPSEPIHQNSNYQIINGPMRRTTGEPNSSLSDEVESVRVDLENFTTDIEDDPIFVSTEPEPEPEIEEEPEEIQPDETDEGTATTTVVTEIIETPKSFVHDTSGMKPRFAPNKQHTGLKNISSGVGAAVTPTNKMEFYQEKTENLGTIKINQPGFPSNCSQSDNVSIISSGEGYTRQGHYDLKFHHNTLW